MTFLVASTAPRSRQIAAIEAVDRLASPLTAGHDDRVAGRRVGIERQDELIGRGEDVVGRGEQANFAARRLVT